MGGVSFDAEEYVETSTTNEAIVKEDGKSEKDSDEEKK